MPQPIRLLHLSDIHFRADTAWDSDPVLRALRGFIAVQIEAGLDLDLVVITGDLAQAGKAAEYALARTWLESLWSTLSQARPEPLPRNRLLLVPGNHDLDRERVGPSVRRIQDALLSEQSQDAIAALLQDEGERQFVLKRHLDYLDFYGAWLGAPQALPWWQCTLHLYDQRLHIAGLDSAWMACGDADRGRLLLGRYQINQTVLHPDGEGADWRLALMHHPWDYLAEFDTHEAHQAIHLHRDLVLRGHLHEGEAFRVLPPDPARACLELAAGSVYAGSRHPNAFQWIELRANPKRVRVQFRALVKGAWTEDRNQPGCREGVAEFLVVPHHSGPETGLRARLPPAADPRKYMEDLWSDTAYIDIRGLVTGGAQAHRFPIADLYIELQATGAAAPVPADPGAEPERQGQGSLLDGRADHPLRAALINPRLVIVGDPGCGKTTFLRWVAHCLAADRLGRDPGAAARHLGLDPVPAGPRLPLLVPIADWLDFMERAMARHLGPPLAACADWLPEYLGARAGLANQGLTADAFRRLLTDGDALILLDGLDEAPDRLQREQAANLIDRLALAYPDCPLVVTSRPAALRDSAVLTGFAQTTIEALDPAAIDGFLARWSRALFADHPERGAAHHRELAAALASRPEIRRLARNTVMLTALAVVHWNDKRLPEQRAELYESIIRWLSEARERRPGREKPQRCRQLLADLALAMQADAKGRQVQVSRRWAAERLAHRFAPAGDGDPEAIERADAFLAEEEIDSGIVVRRGHQLKFWHLTFQEYLAAQALAGRADTDRTRLLLTPGAAAAPALYRPEWRETVLLLGGVLWLQGQDRVDDLVVAVINALGERPTRAEQARAAGLLGALVRDLAPFGYRPADPRYVGMLDAAMAVFDPAQAPAIPLADRIAAAEALAQVGDPRLGWTRPDRWVELPGGRFPMGAQKKDQKAPGYDPEADANEAPVHAVEVGAFAMARFPVTVAEFAEFLEDEDHTDTRWWQAGGADASVAPDNWEDQQAHPSRPVVNVSWYQAMAFCAWLSDRLRRPQGAKGTILLPADRVVRLPTEAEWEYAARGAAGRRYPWGDVAPDAQRANYDQSKVGSPNPVGVFTGDRTPEGVMDLAGNVFEWCLDTWREEQYAECLRQGSATDPLATGDGGSPRVLRGGAFGVEARNLRSSVRYWFGPEVRGRFIGFRCVLAARRQP
jgi:formylglycine-generating enzyme required for sulfatase activity/predicted MPP superfamily phosphohydrolase